jgi:hypothetical protein
MILAPFRRFAAGIGATIAAITNKLKNPLYDALTAATISGSRGNPLPA